MIWSPSKRALEEQEVHNVLQGDYFDLEQSASDTGFSKYQLLSVLFLVLHPLYLRSKIRTEGSMKRTSRFCFMDSYGQCRCAVPCAEPLVSSPEACKAEELLLAAAAFFDEDRMLRVLSVSSWAKQVPIALEGCSLGVAVSEARDDGEFRFVYANTMMQKITGYSMRSLAGKTFKLLEGPETEPEQAQRMAVAIRKQRMLKIGITHHRRNGSAFTNMLVLNPVFDEDGRMLYLLSVSFDLSRREATAQELQQVDVLLSLLPLLLTCQYDAHVRTAQPALAL
jgi:PAS domain S-box-containing protein